MTRRFLGLALILLMVSCGSRQPETGTTDPSTTPGPSATPWRYIYRSAVPSLTPTPRRWASPTRMKSGSATETKSPTTELPTSTEPIRTVASPFDWEGQDLQNDPVIHLQYSPAGKYLIAMRPSGLFVYETADYSLFREIPTDKLLIQDTMNGVPGIAIQPSGELAAVITESGVQVLNWYTGNSVWRHMGDYSDVVFSPDGQNLILMNQNEANSPFSQFEFWTTISWDMIRQFDSRPFPAWDPFFSTDNAFLITGGAGINVYTTQGQWIKTADADPSGYITVTSDVAYSESNNKIAEIRTGTAYLYVWNLPPTGIPVLSRRIILPDYAFYAKLDFSPFGTRLAVGLDDRVLLYDTENWGLDPIQEPQFTGLSEKPAHVIDLCWSPDGARLMGLSSYGEIRVWDAITGEVAD